MKKSELKRIVRTCWDDDFRDNYGKEKGVNWIVGKILELIEEGKSKELPSLERERNDILKELQEANLRAQRCTSNCALLGVMNEKLSDMVKMVEQWRGVEGVKK